MNKQRRKSIKDLIERLNKIVDDIDILRDEEQDCFDSLHENFQNSEMGEQLEEVVDCLDDAKTSLEEIISELENI